MKAVNLLPQDLRRAGASGGSASGAGAYALLGGLAVLVLIVAVWAVSARQVEDRRAEVNRLTAEAQAAEAEAGDLQSFQQFVTTAQQRADTVESLAKKRFDWSSTLQQVSRTLPQSAWITTMAASTSPSVTVEGASNPLRGKSQSPAIEILGCTTSQDDVARLMARLRSISGVESVSLSASTKGESTGGPSGGDPSEGGDCRQGSDRIPQFNIVVFFKAPEGAAPAADTAQTTSTGATK